MTPPAYQDRHGTVHLPWALIRQWAGRDAAIAQREARIEQLERLVWDAIYALQKAGLDREVDRLRRAVQRGD